MTKLPKVDILFSDTFLAMIKNSVGSTAYRNLFVKVKGQRADILKNGELACAFFVSNLLRCFYLITEGHSTVASTIKDLEKSGWQKTKKLKPGAVIVWADKYEKGESHSHIGFCLDEKTAISNSSKARKIAKHHITYGEKNGRPLRAIEAIYTHKKLN